LKAEKIDSKCRMATVLEKPFEIIKQLVLLSESIPALLKDSDLSTLYLIISILFDWWLYASIDS
jgi:hypothetical protein